MILESLGIVVDLRSVDLCYQIRIHEGAQSTKILLQETL
jgi:hypothetical protein